MRCKVAPWRGLPLVRVTESEAPHGRSMPLGCVVLPRVRDNMSTSHVELFRLSMFLYSRSRASVPHKIENVILKEPSI